MHAGELIADMQAKRAEQDVLLRQLAMWAKVREQGISPEAVDVFGFDPKLMTDDERRTAKAETVKRNRGLGVFIVCNDNQNPFGWPIEDMNGKRTIRTLRYNFVRLKTGETVKLSPMIDRP